MTCKVFKYLKIELLQDSPNCGQILIFTNINSYCFQILHYNSLSSESPSIPCLPFTDKTLKRKFDSICYFHL